MESVLVIYIYTYIYIYQQLVFRGYSFRVVEIQQGLDFMGHIPPKIRSELKIIVEDIVMTQWLFSI